MSKASELEAARLAAERLDARCAAISLASEQNVVGDVHVTGILSALAQQMLAEATYISEQRKSGWKSRSDAHTAAGRILEQWAKDLAAYLERDKPPTRPPLETIKSPDRHADLDPADGPISAQITSGLLSQATAPEWPDGTITPDAATRVRLAVEAGKSVDDKLDAAFGSVEPVTHITAAPANYAWCDATSGLRGYVGSANCPDCIARYDAYGEAADKALALRPTEPAIGAVAWLGNGESIAFDGARTDGPVMQVAWNSKGEATVSIPQFSEPGAPPPRQTQRPMTFEAIREHGMTRARGADHRSVSQFTSFAECGVRYALSDLEPPAWWNVGGTALHYACETINLSAYGGKYQYSTDHAVETLWTNCLNRSVSEAITENPTVGPDRWRAAKKGSEGYDWWRVHGLDMVRRWIARLTWLYDQGWTIATVDGRPAIELDCPMRIGETRVENIIDLVMTRQDGTYLIIDAKSGAKAPDSTHQLGQYAHALETVAPGVDGQPTHRIVGAYWLARVDMLSPVDVTKTDTPVDLRDLHPWSEIEYLIRTMDVAESQGLYLPNRTAWCGACGVAGLCPVGPR